MSHYVLFIIIYAIISLGHCILNGTSCPSKLGRVVLGQVLCGASCLGVKKVREKSRECHNHKPQPFSDPKRKRKPTNLNKHKRKLSLE